MYYEIQCDKFYKRIILKQKKRTPMWIEKQINYLETWSIEDLNGDRCKGNSAEFNILKKLKNILMMFRSLIKIKGVKKLSGFSLLSGVAL